MFFWKISLCSPVDYFSLRVSLAETKFMFEFFFPFAVVFVLNFGLYLKGVVRGFFPVGLKGVFFTLSSPRSSLSRPGRLPYKPFQVGAVFVLVVSWVRP